MLLKEKTMNELLAEFDLYKREWQQVGNIKIFFSDSKPYQMLIEKVSKGD